MAIFQPWRLWLGIAVVGVAPAVSAPAPRRAAVSDGEMGAFEIFAVSSLDVVRAQGTARGENSAHLEAARGEWESFQIVVRARPLAATVEVTADALAGPHGASLPAPRIYREGLVELHTPSSVEGGSGPYTDPLFPSVDAYAGERRAAFPHVVDAAADLGIWVEYYVPAGAEAGVYRGDVVVYGSSVSGAAAAAAAAVATTRRIPVELRVHRFVLPASSSLPVTFGFAADTAGRGHYNRAPTEKEGRDLTRLYALAALRHRISLHGGTMDPPSYTTDEAGRMRLDFRAYDSEVGPFLDGDADPKGPAAGARWSAFDLRVPYRLTGPRRAAYTAALVEHLRARGWIGRVFDYTYDEPPPEKFAEVRARADALHAAAPEVPRLVTRALTPALDGDVDIYCPTVNLLDDKPGYTHEATRDAYDALLGRGGRLWWYQACMSHGCDIVGGRYFTGWPSYVIDSPPVAQRVMEWMTFHYRMGGELYFEVVDAYAGGDPFLDIRRHGGNGDGTLFYPGRPSQIGGTVDIPIESIRLKRIRDGLEDYEYLALLAKKKGREYAERYVQKIVRHTYDWDHRPENLYRVRSAIARVLDEE